MAEKKSAVEESAEQKLEDVHHGKKLTVGLFFSLPYPTTAVVNGNGKVTGIKLTPGNYLSTSDLKQDTTGVGWGMGGAYKLTPPVEPHYIIRHGKQYRLIPVGNGDDGVTSEGESSCALYIHSNRNGLVFAHEGDLYILLQLGQSLCFDGKREYVTGYISIPLAEYVRANPWDSYKSPIPTVQKYLDENLPGTEERLGLMKKKTQNKLETLLDRLREIFGIRYVEASLHSNFVLLITWAKFKENETYYQTGGAKYEYTREAIVYLVDAKEGKIHGKYLFTSQTNVDNPYDSDVDADIDDMKVSSRVNYLKLLAKFPDLKDSYPLKMYTSIKKTPFDSTYVHGKAFNGNVIESEFMDKAFWWLLDKIYAKKMEKLRKVD